MNEKVIQYPFSFFLFVSKSFHGRRGKQNSNKEGDRILCPQNSLGVSLSPLQAVRIFSTTVSTLVLALPRTVFSSLAFTACVTYFASDARAWLAGPTQKHTRPARNTKRANSLLRKSTFIWRRVITMTLRRLLGKGMIGSGLVQLVGVANVRHRIDLKRYMNTTLPAPLLHRKLESD